MTLDMINEKVTSLLLYAEKECRKLRIGEIDFSSEASKAAKT